MNMRIYHYTNIDSLALILKNRTIRFNRLDNVDDLEEGKAESLGIKFCKYVFVSCWTKNREENVPLWKMYGGDRGGIRISMDHEMFQEYPVRDLEFNGLKSTGCFMSKIPSQDMQNPNFFIIPIHQYENDMFFRDIQYVDDIHEYTKDKIRLSDIHDNRATMNMEMKPFGYYKNKRWKFQEESRFVLYVLPCNPFLEGANPEVSSIVMNSLLQNKVVPFFHYDLRLKDAAIENLVITLSPSITESQRIMETALRDQYIPNAIIEESSLGTLVRLK